MAQSVKYFICFSSVTSSSILSEDSTSFNTSSISTNNEVRVSTRVDNFIPAIVEPVDYENYNHQHHACCGVTSRIENDDSLIEFPDGSNDVDVYVLARKVRTLVPAGPEEDM